MALLISVSLESLGPCNLSNYSSFLLGSPFGCLFGFALCPPDGAVSYVLAFCPQGRLQHPEWWLLHQGQFHSRQAGGGATGACRAAASLQRMGKGSVPHGLHALLCHRQVGPGQQLRKQTHLGSGMDRASVQNAGSCLALVPIHGPLIPKTSSFPWSLAQHQSRKSLKRFGPLPSSLGTHGGCGSDSWCILQPGWVSPGGHFNGHSVFLLVQFFSGWLCNGDAWAQGVRRKHAVSLPFLTAALHLTARPGTGSTVGAKGLCRNGG